MKKMKQKNILEKKLNIGKFGLFYVPTASTRHKRLHVNVLMAQRYAHELHEVPQVTRQN